MIQFDDHIFSDGLKPPTSLCVKTIASSSSSSSKNVRFSQWLRNFVDPTSLNQRAENMIRDRNIGCLLYIGGLYFMLPSYIGIIS